MNSDKNTYAIVLIKTEIGHENAIRNWLDTLPHTFSQATECPNCIFSKDGMKKACIDIEFFGSAVISGHFDFMLIIGTDGLSMVQDFVFWCVRDRFKSEALLDTQTIVGVAIPS